jgi:hypothetical protein
MCYLYRLLWYRVRRKHISRYFIDLDNGSTTGLSKLFQLHYKGSFSLATSRKMYQCFLNSKLYPIIHT